MSGMSKNKARGVLSMRHSDVVLKIDLKNASLDGYVEHQLVCKSKSLTRLHFHARQLVVSKVLYNGLPTEFQQLEFLSSPCDVSESARDIKHFTNSYKDSLDEEDKGSLIISIPDQEQATLTRGTPLTIRIYYTVTKPTSGIHFSFTTPSQVNIEEEYGINISERLPEPQMFSHNEVESARCWIPCLDRYSQPCTWKFQYTVPKGNTVISSGKLIGTEKKIETIADTKHEMTVFRFQLDIPTTIKNIAIAAGHFETYLDPVIPSISYFCKPELLQTLQHTVNFLHKAYRFYEEYLHAAFPYDSLSMVFVDNSYSKLSSCATLAIMSSQLLHDPSIIDKTIKSRWLLSLAVAIQWFGCYIGIKSWSDMWLRFGLSSHLAGLFFQCMFGQQEYRLRQYKDFINVSHLDNGKPPLNWNGALHPIQYYHPLILKKAPIVIAMIERRLTFPVFQKIMASIVNPDAPVSRLSTRIFLKAVKNEGGWKDVKNFEQQWITGRGCPKMITGFMFNKKRQQTEFAVKQYCFSVSERFTGTLIVRVNELDGTYDYSIPITDEIHGIDLRCQSRLRKNRKKKIQFPNGQETEVDLSRRDSPLLWIRVDPKCNWGPLIEFKQPEYMWIYQLEMDRDPVAQYQAIHALSDQPTANASTSLSQLMANSNIFYSIRVEAAKGLAQCANKETEWVSLDMLLEFFRAQYSTIDPKKTSPNQFSDVSSYHLKKSVISAVSTIKDKEGYTPSDVLDFLLELLIHNDNSQNKFSDYKYIATIIRALANTNTSAPQNVEQIQNQIFKHLKAEKQHPSYQRAITVACLKSLGDMQAKKKLQLPLSFFASFSRYGHHESVRIAAFKSIILLFCPSSEGLSLVIQLLENPVESSRLKYKLLSAWCEFITTNKVRVAPFQENAPENIQFCNFLWCYLNSVHTTYDSRLRWNVIELYQNIWGQDTPSCLPPIKEPPPKLVVPSSSDLISISNSVPSVSITKVENERKGKPSRRRNSDFLASFNSDAGLLRINVLNPSKRQKLTSSVSRNDALTKCTSMSNINLNSNSLAGPNLPIKKTRGRGRPKGQRKSRASSLGSQAAMQETVFYKLGQNKESGISHTESNISKAKTEIANPVYSASVVGTVVRIKLGTPAPN